MVSCGQKQRSPKAGEEQEERVGLLEQGPQGLLLTTIHCELQSRLSSLSQSPVCSAVKASAMAYVAGADLMLALAFVLSLILCCYSNFSL